MKKSFFIFISLLSFGCAQKTDLAGPSENITDLDNKLLKMAIALDQKEQNAVPKSKKAKVDMRMQKIAERIDSLNGQIVDKTSQINQLKKIRAQAAGEDLQISNDSNENLDKLEAELKNLKGQKVVLEARISDLELEYLAL